MSAPLLSCRDVCAGYGGVPVVRDFNLEADSGSVVAILGPNGAGKTTLMLSLAGLLPTLGGEVRIGGELVPHGRAAAANHAGLVCIPDDRALFTTLTVRENIAAAIGRRGVPTAEVHDMFPALAARWNTRAGALSGGEQQMLAVARAMVQRPKVLLIDEMSMGLAPVLVERLLPVVRQLADNTGAVVLLVEQHVHLALDVADHAVVLVHGQVAFEASTAALADDPSRLEMAYRGEVVRTASPI
jgi:branched-chain amino acid transport system ATP-binding protein